MNGQCTKCNEESEDLLDVDMDKCWIASLCPKCSKELRIYFGVRHGITIELTKQEEDWLNYYAKTSKEPIKYSLGNGTVQFTQKGGKQIDSDVQ